MQSVAYPMQPVAVSGYNSYHRLLALSSRLFGSGAINGSSATLQRIDACALTLYLQARNRTGFVRRRRKCMTRNSERPAGDEAQRTRCDLFRLQGAVDLRTTSSVSRV